MKRRVAMGHPVRLPRGRVRHGSLEIQRAGAPRQRGEAADQAQGADISDRRGHLAKRQRYHRSPMTETIAIPAWLVALAAAIVVWSVLDRLLIPSTRWFLRRRINRIVDELNTRLQFQIPSFKLTKRKTLIDRLASDPKVMQAVDSRAEDSGVPREVLRAEVERYAREIVPSFNAYAYFRIGNYVARRIAQLLYRIRLGYADDDALSKIGANASVVFVMNHRSNMDYLIVAFLASSRTALSYAVGEWAKVWPLQTLIRSLGAYFVRRNSGNPLYRQVLARYVQMATKGGVVQAMYPEGGLSRDGRLRPLKLGLISYMVSAFDPEGDRDLVFIPVGISYDRVLEDRSLIRELDPEAERRSAGFALATLMRAVGHNSWLMLRRRWYRFGYACVNFGAPISMRAYCSRRHFDFRRLDAGPRAEAVQQLGDELISAIAAVIPVLPVSLVATVFVQDLRQSMSALEIKAKVQSLVEELERRQAYVHVPRADRDYAVAVGLRMLVLRRLVIEADGLYRADTDEATILRYYANSIGHFFAQAR